MRSIPSRARLGLLVSLVSLASFAAFAGVALVACDGGGARPAPASAATAVDRAASSTAVAHELDDFHDAAAHADEARYFGHFTSDAVFLGTDATERWDLTAFRAFARPHFAKGKAWSFHAIRRAITVTDDGRFAYFDEDLATEKLGPARGSGVLVSRDGGWKIAQYNLTTVIPNERFDEVRALLDHPAAAPPPPAH
jgi:hypothetical protein